MVKGSCSYLKYMLIFLYISDSTGSETVTDDNEFHRDLPGSVTWLNKQQTYSYMSK